MLISALVLVGWNGYQSQRQDGFLAVEESDTDRIATAYSQDRDKLRLGEFRKQRPI